MRDYGTCACGKYQAFGSIAPPPCRSCSKCNTRPGPDGQPLAPAAHEFKAKMVDTDEGPKPLSRCIHCLRTPGQIQREAEAAALTATAEIEQAEAIVAEADS